MKNLLGMVLIMLAASSMAQKQFRGKVIDSSTKVPIPMAIISSDHAKTYSDAKGIFHIRIKNQNDRFKINHPKFDEKWFSASDSIEVFEMSSSRREILEDLEIVESDHFILGSATVSDNKQHKSISGKQMCAGYTCISPSSIMPHTPFTSNEEYGYNKENKFLLTSNNPLSTFSSDVDVASYARIRRFLKDGSLPPTDAVRVEEMINYFTYAYQEPTDNNPVGLIGEMGNCLWNPDHLVLRVAIKAKEIEQHKLPPSNIVFLIDVSGSMNSQDKLPLLQSSLKILVPKMRAQDKISLVTYAGSTRVVLPSTSASSIAKIMDAINGLNASGATAGAAGLTLAYREAEKGFIKDGNNRIVLATDGDFNVGPASVDALIDIVNKKRESNIFMSVLGFGKGNLKDNKMEAIADNGNGNYAYIDNLLEAKKVLLKEYSSTLYTIAKDTKIQVEFNPGKVEAYRLIGYENRLLDAIDFNNDKKDAGELGAGHTVTALYEIIPKGGKQLVDPLRYGKNTMENSSTEWALVKLRYKDPTGKESKYIEYPIRQKKNIENDDYIFASAVACFGMKLRGSEYVDDLDYSTIANWALEAKGKDTNGYRTEFVKLVELAGLMEYAQK